MLFSLFILAPMLATPSAAAACTLTGGLDIHVVAQPGAVAIRSDMRLDEIGALAARAGRTMQRPPLGFYVGQFRYKVRVAPAAGGASCQEKSRVTIDMQLTGRMIEIGQELRHQPCRLAAALRHYRRHAQADEAVFARYLAPVAAALREASPPMPSHDATSRAPTQAEIVDWARSVVDRVLEPLTPERNAAQAAVDTAAEMQTLDQSCTRSI